jgi:hypothetical protein
VPHRVAFAASLAVVLVVRYDELALRQGRVQKMKRVLEGIQQKRNLLGKGRRSKVTII